MKPLYCLSDSELELIANDDGDARSEDALEELDRRYADERVFGIDHRYDSPSLEDAGLYVGSAEDY